MAAILLPLTFLVLVANMALVSVCLSTGQRLDTSVDLYVYPQQGEKHHLVLQEHNRAIRLDLDTLLCFDPFFSEFGGLSFESLPDFYARSATRTFTMSAVDALAILECRWQVRLIPPAVEDEIRFV